MIIISLTYRLLETVFGRFERELGEHGYLLRSTMCLLEAARSGLREQELKELLYLEKLEHDQTPQGQHVRH